jgi:hypothetical protein
MNPEQQRDEELWQVAKARVGFRWSLATYVIVNAMLVVIWFFSSGAGSYFWPIWSIMGWGVGIAFQYFHAFHGNKFTSTREEYDKLKRQQNSNNY